MSSKPTMMIPFTTTCIIRKDKQNMMSKRKTAMLRRARSCGDICSQATTRTRAATATTSSGKISGGGSNSKPLGRWESQAANSDTSSCTACMRKLRRSHTDGCVQHVNKDTNDTTNPSDHDDSQPTKQVRFHSTATTSTTTAPPSRHAPVISRWDSGSSGHESNRDTPCGGNNKNANFNQWDCDACSLKQQKQKKRRTRRNNKRTSNSCSPPRLPRSCWGLAA